MFLISKNDAQDVALMECEHFRFIVAIGIDCVFPNIEAIAPLLSILINGPRRGLRNGYSIKWWCVEYFEYFTRAPFSHVESEIVVPLEHNFMGKTIRKHFLRQSNVKCIQAKDISNAMHWNWSFVSESGQKSMHTLTSMHSKRFEGDGKQNMKHVKHRGKCN